MLIERVEVYHVLQPLVTPWRTAYGDDHAVETVLVRMQSGKLEGWGEATPLAAPCYSPEWAAGAFACIRDWLAPALVGQQIESGEDLQARLARFKGNPFAKAALDSAWWVLRAHEKQMPLHRLLGATRDRIDVGADFSVMDDIDALVAAIDGAVRRGFKRVKLKYRPGWDVPMLHAVRSVFPSLTLHIDCNAAYSERDFDMFCRLDDFGLAMIEQPLGYDDLVDHARLQQAIRTPVCLDESVNSVARAEQALDLGSCQWMNIKPGRVGGLTNALRIHNLCQQVGVPCWVGGMLESAIGSRICMALGMLDNFSYPADIFPSDKFYRPDLAEPAVELVVGPDGSPQVAAAEVAGIGSAPDIERLDRQTIARADISAG